MKSSLGTRLTVQWDKALTCSSKGGWTYSLCIPFIRPSLEVGWLIRLHYINNTELATGLIRQCVLHVHLKPSVVVWSQAVSRARPMARPTWVLLARLEIKWGEISYLQFWELVLMAWSRKAQGAGNPMLLGNSRTRYWCTELQSLVAWALPKFLRGCRRCPELQKCK